MHKDLGLISITVLPHSCYKHRGGTVREGREEKRKEEKEEKEEWWRKKEEEKNHHHLEKDKYNLILNQH